MFSVALSLLVLSVKLAEVCGRPYQLGSEGWRALIAHSASNTFLTPPSVKHSKMLYTGLYSHYYRNLKVSNCFTTICYSISMFLAVVLSL